MSELPPARPPPVLKQPVVTQSGRPASHEDIIHASHARPRYDRDDSTQTSGSTFSAAKHIRMESPSHLVETEKKRSSRGSDYKYRSRKSIDPEKASASPAGSRDRLRRSDIAPAFYTNHDDEATVRQEQESHALKILLFLSGPCVLLSFLNAMWTLVSLLLTVFSQPVRLCAKRPSFGQQLGGLLGPALNLQLKCIYTPLPPHADEDASYHPLMLVTVQFLSPFLSIGVALSAWVVAVFWISSLVVGDPSGTDRHDDGSETVMLLRKFWENWLYRSIRQD